MLFLLRCTNRGQFDNPGCMYGHRIDACLERLRSSPNCNEAAATVLPTSWTQLGNVSSIVQATAFEAVLRPLRHKVITFMYCFLPS